MNRWIAPNYDWPRSRRSRALGSTAFRVGQQSSQKDDAWASITAHQQNPQLRELAKKHVCPPGFLFSPEGATCVNYDGVQVALAPSGVCFGSEYFWCSSLVLYLTLNEANALASGSIPKVNDAVLRGLRTLRMTEGDFGWQKVSSEIRAVATLLSRSAEFASSAANVDATANHIGSTIAPYYDADVASAKRAASTPTTTGGGPSLLLLAAVAFGGLYYFKPAIAKGLLSKGASAGKTIVSKVKGLAR